MINNLQKYEFKTEQFAEKVLQMITNTWLTKSVKNSGI